MTAIPAYCVAFLALTTTLYTLYTAWHRLTAYSKLKWFGASIPIALIAVAFAWQGYNIPMAYMEFEKYQCIYWSVGCGFLYPTLLFVGELWVRWSEHGRQPNHKILAR